jgi:hypothetical protein
MAKRNKPSQVKIHRRDGTFTEERTCSDAPFPPRGFLIVMAAAQAPQTRPARSLILLCCK